MKIIRREPKHSLQSELYPDFINTILQRRPLTSKEDFDLGLRHLLPFHSLLNIEKATDLVVTAIKENQEIVMVGDYDVDGATSIALSMRIFHEFGHRNIRYVVPHRVFDGYGLSRSIVNKLAYDKVPDLLITVDNGISNIEGVALAKSLGMKVIVTDHHLPPETLPDADAIVNPNLEGDPFESKALAGVGVIYYLLLSVRARLHEEGYFGENPPNLGKYLDIVALGTVADLVPLDANNRRLVQQGLARIRHGRTIHGINALIEASSKDRDSLSTSDIGFGLAPLLNAAGRLDDMTIGIECLLANDYPTARKYAFELYELNQARRQIEGETRERADVILSTLKLKEETLPNSIALYDESWHQGVTGIVASRIKEQYFRPTFIFAYDDEGVLKGSGRSIKGLHIRDILSNVAQKHQGMILSFGGHAMAAGLSLLERHFDEFRESLEEEVSRFVSDETFNQVIYSDGELPIEAYSTRIADQLRLAFPWGQEFPEPCFDAEFELMNYRILKDQHIKMTLKHPQFGEIFDAIAFFQAHQIVDNARRVHCAFKLDVNEWMGRRNFQMIVDYFEVTA